jgi:hypothetical protein
MLYLIRGGNIMKKNILEMTDSERQAYIKKKAIN